MQRASSVWLRVLTQRLVFAILIALSTVACVAGGDDSEFGDVASEQQPLTALVQVNSGGGAVSPFAA
ncbi:MAG TPA: hypothetical protein VGP93_04765, partial [Polyangiaceae bacterium]|nr:hypothetical protein [Polyangiaceae bacterium]